MSMNYAKNTVLVLDDDPFQQKLISQQLLKHDVEVHTYLQGKEAIDYLFLDEANHRCILILIDLEMPEMDGVEFLRHLADRKFKGSVAFMSGQDQRVLESASRLATASNLKLVGCLPKPVQPDEIEDVLGRWREHKSGRLRTKPKTYEAREIQRAIANKELVNFYQPKVDVRSGIPTGVETLVRWQHPSDGLVFPDQFIGVAEENELIEDLTRAVLGEALNQAKRWHEQGLTLRIAVNVSMDNLKRVDFPDYVLSELQRTGFDPRSLILEVTESKLTHDARLPLDILTRLRMKKISLSIDDFGTGHSSLAQLRDLPFDELKIDRGFVHGAGSNNTLRSIFDASVTMSTQLGLKVVAEGVEDRKDWDFLRAHGCDLAQGYFIAKPMPAAEIPAWLADWKSRCCELYPQ